MASFVMLTRLGDATSKSPEELSAFIRRATKQIETECPSVLWRASCVVLGPFDYVDIFDAPDVETALRVAAAFRGTGRAITEVWPAANWEEFSQPKQRRTTKRSSPRK
jgi:uncharacterized protein with GYD domain